MLRFFVYGTLKPRECNYLRYCEGKAIEEEPAYVYGQLFSLPVGYPAMTKGEGCVQGFLLSFGNQQILSDLDRLEDYNPHRPAQQNAYERQITEVFAPSGKSLGNAWAYLMTIERIQHYGGVLLPQGCWNGERR